MSAGPIKREREAHRPAIVSTTDVARICMRNPDTNAAYCGRKARKPLVSEWALAVCADCAAAARADGRLR